jgi:folate-binding protein YgfZ
MTPPVPTAPPPLPADAAGSAPAAVVAPVPGLGLLTFEGPDAAAFLHAQLSSDVMAMAPGSVGWSSYNSPKGRMLGSLLLWRRAPDAFAALVAHDLAEALAKRLSMFVLRAKVVVADRTTTGQRFGVAGTGARAAIAAALGEAPDPAQGMAIAECLVIATPDGRYVVHAPVAIATTVSAQLAARAQAVAADHWDWLAIAAGVPLITRATQDRFIPQSANWDLVGGVNFRKGCYPGQEIVARMQYLGRLKERLLAFHVAAVAPAPGTPIFSGTFGDQACGTVVNAAAAPGGGSDLLAVMQWAALDDAGLHLATADGPRLSPRALPYPVPPPVAPNRPKL